MKSSIRNSLFAICAGLFAGMIIDFAIGGFLLLLSGFGIGWPQQVRMDVLWVIETFAMGFVAALLASRYKVAHAIMAGVVLYVYLPVLLFMFAHVPLFPEIAETHPNPAMRLPLGDINTLFDAFAFTYSNLNLFRVPLFFSMILTGALCVLLLMHYNQKRAGRTGIQLRYPLKIVGFLSSLIGASIYLAVPLFLVLFIALPFLIVDRGIVLIGLLLLSMHLIKKESNVLAGIGTFLSITVSLIIAYALTFRLQLVGPSIPGLMVALGVLALLTMPVGARMHRMGRRIQSLVYTFDGSPDVLLLWPFKIEKEKLGSITRTLMSYFSLRDPSYISRISRLTKKEGYSLAAVSNPNSNIPPALAAWLHSGDEWETLVRNVSKEAKKIFVILGDSKGLLTEMDILVDENALSKTLLLLPPHSLGSSAWDHFWNHMNALGIKAPLVAGSTHDSIAVSFTNSQESVIHYTTSHSNQAYRVLFEQALYGLT